MSLTGNLEDLPLLDILQIVSFSKKTGYLGISTSEGEGAIVFRDGFVVASFTWELPPLAAGVAALPAGQHEAQIRRRIETALERLIRLREGQFQFSLTDAPPLAIKGRDISQETLDPGINPQELLLDLARGMDEDRRDSSAALEASFAEPEPEFEPPPAWPTEEPVYEPPPPAVVDVEVRSPLAEPPVTPPPGVDTGRFVAPRDVSPEYTVPLQAISLDLLRALSPPAAPPVEEPKETQPEPPVEAPPAKPAEAAPAEPSPAPSPTLLLVDDEEDVRRSLAQSLTAGGFQVVEAEDPDAAVKKAQRLEKAGIPFILVTDLGMPASGGSSFQGGFEVVKRLGKMKLTPPVVLMTDSLSGAVRTRAKQMGVAALEFKPGLSKLDPVQYQADLQAFARRLLEEVLPGLQEPAAKATQPTAAQPGMAAKPSHEESSREIKLLQVHIGELRGLADPARLPPLVMRVARHFFERAVLFLVKDDEIRGLGGFGLAGQGESLNAVARQILVPAAEPSMFLDVISTGKPFAGEPAPGGWNDAVRSRLGRFRAGSVVLLPLVAHRDTIAVLYGDNPETGRALGQTEALELFMHQAGIAMENALLQKKLRGQAETG